jgi:hypothetical protein
LPLWGAAVDRKRSGAVLSREAAGCPGDWLLISRLAGPFFEPAAVAAL